MGDPVIRLQDLDARHGELIDRLAELDRQISDVLDEWARSKADFLEEQQKRNLIFDREAEVAGRRLGGEADSEAA